jgi:hypothetical protein
MMSVLGRIVPLPLVEIMGRWIEMVLRGVVSVIVVRHWWATVRIRYRVVVVRNWMGISEV